MDRVTRLRVFQFQCGAGNSAKAWRVAAHTFTQAPLRQAVSSYSRVRCERLACNTGESKDRNEITGMDRLGQFVRIARDDRPTSVYAVEDQIRRRRLALAVRRPAYGLDGLHNLQLRNWVYVFSNVALLATAVVGECIYLRNKHRGV